MERASKIHLSKVIPCNMNFFYQLRLCIGFLLKGELVRTEMYLQEHSQFIFLKYSVVSCGQPSLRPFMYYFCPNETVTNHYILKSPMCIIVGVPYQNNVQITYQFQDTHYTAVVQLADMFDGGGVQINHYNIELDNGILVRTSGPTYSVDVAYNVTVFMNISAYSCAGYSDPFILEISEG